MGTRGAPSATHALLLAAGLAAACALYLRALPLAPPAVAAAATPPARPEPVRALTPGTSLDGFPDWSPDGRQVVFMRDGRIWVMAADGSGARALSAGPEGTWEVAPVWSPDGSRIAFIRYNDGDPVESALVAVRPAGGGEQVLTQEQGLMGFAAWHPSGQEIAYTLRDRLVVLDLRSRQRRTVVALGDGMDMLPGGVAWTPDGQWLVFGAGQRGTGRPDLDLYRVPAAGGQPERLTQGGGQMPHVARDGQRVAYRNPRERTGIYVLDLTTGQSTPLLRDSGPHVHFHPRWSPDGTRLAASRLTVAGKGGRVHLTSAIVVVMVQAGPPHPPAAHGG